MSEVVRQEGKPIERPDASFLPPDAQADLDLAVVDLDVDRSIASAPTEQFEAPRPTPSNPHPGRRWWLRPRIALPTLGVAALLGAFGIETARSNNNPTPPEGPGISASGPAVTGSLESVTTTPEGEVADEILIKDFASEYARDISGLIGANDFDSIPSPLHPDSGNILTYAELPANGSNVDGTDPGYSVSIDGKPTPNGTADPANFTELGIDSVISRNGTDGLTVSETVEGFRVLREGNNTTITLRVPQGGSFVDHEFTTNPALADSAGQVDGGGSRMGHLLTTDALRDLRTDKKTFLESVRSGAPVGGTDFKALK